MIKEENLIFIGGAPRSGTSLIQKILDNHSTVYAGPEFDHLHAICNLYDSMLGGIENKRQVAYYTKNPLKESFKQLIYSNLVNNLEKKDITHVSDKTPMNALVFDRIKELFPKSKFIFIIRDPRAILYSMKKVYKRALKYGDNVGVGFNTLKDLRSIKSYIQSGQDFFFDNQNSCTIIHYEELINAPKQTIKDLCITLGLQFQPNMLQTYNENDTSKILKTKTIRSWYDEKLYNRKIDKDSLFEWKDKMNKKDILLANAFFNHHKLPILKTYQFPKPNFFQKVLLSPNVIREKGIKRSVKSIFYNVKKS